MNKPPEEGDIWEWRAFGQINPHLRKQISAHPIRMGICDLRGEDIYLVSPTSEHNVKLRRGQAGWWLKFKLLLESEPDAIELYNETAKMMFAFPVRADAVEMAAHFLQVRLAETVQPDKAFDTVAFMACFPGATPAVQIVSVQKVRSQFEFDDGWVEIADVQFPKQRVASLSVHAFDRANVRDIVSHLQPDTHLTAMNYLAACRLWA